MVTLTDVTTGTVDGTGYFDKFMAAMNAQIDLQYTLKRIQGPDFAKVYLGALQSAMSQAITFAQVVDASTRTTAEVALLDQKTKTEKAQIMDDLSYSGTLINGLVGKQKDLQTQQANGFIRDAEQKALKIILDTWSVSKSVVGTSLPAPEGALNDDISDMITKLRAGIGITESIYQGVADAGADFTVALNTVYVPMSSAGCTDRPDDTEPDPVNQPPSGYIWTQVSGTPTALTLPHALGVETTDQVVSFTAPGAATVLVYRLEAVYAYSDPDTSSFDTISITVE
jgi:hypothetical protein